MERRAVLGFSLVLLIGMFSCVFNMQLVGCEGLARVEDDESVTFCEVPIWLEKFFSMFSVDRHSAEDFMFRETCTFKMLSQRNLFSGDDESIELVIGINGSQINSLARLKALAVKHGGQLVKTLSMEGKVKAALVKLSLENLFPFTREVELAALSRYIEPHFQFYATIVPNDYYWERQWGPAKIEADKAWNFHTGDSSVLVAVIDTGIDYNHPDLAANYVPLGYDWVNSDTDPMDDNGHGTHCAGILVGELNNGIGIAGLAQVRVMAEKGLNEYGRGGAVDLANAIVHAVDQGADIISNSWGGPLPSKLIHEAIKYAYNHGVLVVASAGNEASDMELYPAAYEEVIAVTATDALDTPALFTSYGDWVELAAPGVNIYSAVSKVHSPRFSYPYDYLSGTSMACPHVAGVAALIWSQFPNMTRDEVRLRLRYTADDLGEPGFDIYYGYGRINAKKAVEKPLQNHELLIWNFEVPSVLEFGENVLINVTVLNFGLCDEENITMQLLVNGECVDSKHVSSLVSGGLARINFSWNPTAEGNYNVTFYVKPMIGETITINNFLSVNVLVKTPRVLKVPEEYYSIQDAVDAAQVKDVIMVSAGVYYESVAVTKSVSIIGEGSGNTTIFNFWKEDAAIQIAADNVFVSGFSVVSNEYGVLLYHSVTSTFRDVHVLDAARSFVVYGYTISEFIHSIDTSNIVRGKPVYYLVNQHGVTIDSSVFQNIGLLAVVNSTDVRVASLNLTFEGPFLAYTTCSIIENVTVSEASVGITLYRSNNNTIIGNFLSSLSGIELVDSDENVICDNLIVDCSVGICLEEGSFANVLKGNIVIGANMTVTTEEVVGMDFSWSGGNFLYNNTVFNGDYGIQLFGSGSNVLRGNNINMNCSLTVDGNALSHFIQDIDYSNVAYGKPICYLVNQKNITIEPPTFSDIGFLGVVNSTNVVVKDLRLIELQAHTGVLFAFTENSIIANVTVSECKFGVSLIGSANNQIINNMVYNNSEGICLRESDFNHVWNNTLLYNRYNIYLETSNYNNLSSNKLQTQGIDSVNVLIEFSSNNTLLGNIMEGGEWDYGIMLGWSYDNKIEQNDIHDLHVGIVVGLSSNNVLSENHVENCVHGISIVLEGNNNLVCRNVVSTNWRGLWVSFNSNNNTIYFNNFVYNDINAEADGVNSWDNGYLYGGNYWSDYEGIDNKSGPEQNLHGSDGIGDSPYIISDNNQDRYPLMKPWNPPPLGVHDIKIVSVTPSVTEVYVGWTINISVVVQNIGEFAENCTIIAYYDSTPIGTKTAKNLFPNENVTLTVCWNTLELSLFPLLYHNYTIRVESRIVFGETNTANNNMTSLFAVKFKMTGDVNDDCEVNMQDVYFIILAFGATPANPRWSLQTDMNQDNKINMQDIYLTIINLGKTH